MITDILIYESQHHQQLFPLSRFRAMWDIPTGINSLRQLLQKFFPGAQQWLAPLRGREYLLENPLSGTAALEERAGYLPTEAKLWQPDRIFSGSTLVVHAHWQQRQQLLDLSQHRLLEPVLLQAVPLLQLFPEGQFPVAAEWYRSLQEGHDPLAPADLPRPQCVAYPWDILPLLAKNIIFDATLLPQERFTHRALPQIYGPRQHLYLHKESEVQPGVVIDTRQGAVVLDRGASIAGPSLVQGPIYIGPNSSVDGAKLRGQTHIGHTCKIAGEIENSLILDFSNKHHDGFMGHSMVGSWANWGSLANTSDLKNNYGTIRMWNKGEDLDSGLIKLGTLCGDFVKIAIGMQINTGTVMDCAANIFGNQPQSKYIPGFSWGIPGPGEENSYYEIERFLKDSAKIMARRKQELPSALAQELRETWKALCAV